MVMVQGINGRPTLSDIRCSNPKSMATLIGLASLEDIFLNLFAGGAAHIDITHITTQ